MTGFRGGAGTLKRRITIHRRPDPEAQNPVGASSDSWPAQYTDVPAAYEPLGGLEFPLNEKRHEQTTARFRIRYKPSIDPATHSISHIPDRCANPPVTQVFDIHSVIQVNGERFELEIEVSETK